MSRIFKRSFSSPLSKYNELVKRNKLKYDDHQLKTIHILEDLHKRLLEYTPKTITPNQERVLKRRIDAGKDELQSPDFAWIEQNEQSIFKSVFNLFKKRGPASQDAHYGPKGLYIYGDVGTGKSMMMDLFYLNFPRDGKQRVHFHHFMQDIHKRIHEIKREGITSDPIPIISADLASKAWLLCFDELQVTDIADAMILRRLFSELFIRGVVMVTTSNRHPDELYKNGIQRASFMPAIELIKTRCQLHSLNSGVDYRRMKQKQLQVFFNSKDENTKSIMSALFNKIRKEPVKTVKLELWGRELVFQECSGRILTATFEELCCGPLSAADYLEITKNFDTVFLYNIPRMGFAQRNEARRFITLIDNFYDQKVKLIASFETALEDLMDGDKPQLIHSEDRMLFDDLKLSTNQLHSSIFTGEEEIFAFQRAISRLVEMQSENWLGQDLAQLIKDSM